MFNQIYPHHLDHLDKKELLKAERKELYMHILLRSFGISLLTFFIPVYLLQLGFNLTQVFTYLLLQWGFFGIFAPFAAKIIQRFGIKEMLIARIPLVVLALISIVALEDTMNTIQLYFTAILFGFTAIVYWLSIGDLFSKFIGRHHKAERTGKYVGFPRLAEIVGPFLGGFIAFSFGFPVLFILISIILFLSLVPLFFLKGVLDHPRFDFLIFKRFRYMFRDFKFLTLRGFKGDILRVVLPVVVFLNAVNVFELGILMSIVSLANFLFNVKVGFIADRLGIRRVIRIGSVVCTILFCAMGYFSETPMLMILSVVMGFFSVLMDVPYETYHFVRAKRFKSPMEYIVFKEISLTVGRIILYGGLILLSYRFDIMFYLGSVSSLLFTLF